MSEEIRVLAVRQPWASLIVEGLKTIEVRSSPTNIRGRVAIYGTSRCVTNSEENAFLRMFSGFEDDDLLSFQNREIAERCLWGTRTFGFVVGTVEIVDSTQCSGDLEYKLYENEHFAPAEYFAEENTYFWHLRRPVKFSNPINYTPPRGAVRWSKTVLPEGY